MHNNQPTLSYLKWWTPCVGYLKGHQLYMRKDNHNTIAIWKHGYMQVISQ